jgi:prepilin-type N-terminal cleavage/methylation domain-containing protein
VSVRPPARCDAAGRATFDDGFSLIEVLLSVVIMGLVFVAILGSMGTSIVASDVHRQQADVGAVAVSAAERIASHDLVYVACATPTTSSYLAEARAAAPTGWPVSTIAIADVKYETFTAVTASFRSGLLNCLDSRGIKVQEVTVKVTSPDGRASTTLAVVKNGDA